MTNPYSLSSTLWGQYIQYTAYAVAIGISYVYASGFVAGSYLHKLNNFLVKK